MRRCRAALTALMLALLSLLVAGPAQAGGPTSVLLVVPGVGQTASLYTGDADYDTLARTVGAFSDTGTVGKVDSTGAEHATVPGVTLTWLIHDTSVWRVDRVYLDAEGGPWISTQVDHTGSGNIWNEPPVWHTPVDAKLLAALLHRLGVDGSTSPGQQEVTTGVDTPVTATEQPAPAAEQVADATGLGAERLGWGLGGLALGVALALAATRLGRRPRPMADEPPEVPDVGAERPSDEDDWSRAEELQRG